MHEIIQYFEKKIADPSSGPKLVGYCCHDINIASVLKVFEAYERHLPAYACSLFLELRQKNGSNYLNITYKQEEDVPISVLGHDFDIKFEDFKNCLSHCILSKEEFYNECAA